MRHPGLAAFRALADLQLVQGVVGATQPGTGMGMTTFWQSHAFLQGYEPEQIRSELHLFFVFPSLGPARAAKAETVFFCPQSQG